MKRGQMFVQPVMGAREFPAYFTWGSTGETPIQESLDLGLMVYDVFDLNIWKEAGRPSVSLSTGRKWTVGSLRCLPLTLRWC